MAGSRLGRCPQLPDPCWSCCARMPCPMDQSGSISWVPRVRTALTLASPNDGGNCGNTRRSGSKGKWEVSRPELARGPMCLGWTAASPPFQHPEIFEKCVLMDILCCINETQRHRSLVLSIISTPPAMGCCSQFAKEQMWLLQLSIPVPQT